MLIALLVAAAQPAQAAQPSQPAQPPAEEPAIDVTASVRAYVNWRVCLDSQLGQPPRPVAPAPRAVDAAFAACRPQQDTLRAATAAAFGPQGGAEVYATMVREGRTQVSAPFPPRR